MCVGFSEADVVVKINRLMPGLPSHGVASGQSLFPGLGVPICATGAANAHAHLCASFWTPENGEGPQRMGKGPAWEPHTGVERPGARTAGSWWRLSAICAGHCPAAHLPTEGEVPEPARPRLPHVAGTGTKLQPNVTGPMTPGLLPQSRGRI